MLKHEYARSALGLGLGLQAKTGVNPYNFGMIGRTDAHSVLAVAEEDNWWGVRNLPGEERTMRLFFSWEGLTVRAAALFAASYAAVWATENTRAAIFDALKCREVYATTGSRMTVRFFGGWQYAHGDQQNPHLPWVGYAKGVPMGSDLPPWVSANAAPSFLVLALKDPEGANLDRIQIVKGRLDAEDDSLERIYDVALSDGRTPDTRGVPPVGSSVDVANASDTNSLGTVQLAAVWRDPDFDAKRPAFYYARVLEIPTPPWTTYEAKRFGSAIPDGTPRTHQERAYTSPIWYTPSRAN